MKTIQNLSNKERHECSNTHSKICISFVNLWLMKARELFFLISFCLFAFLSIGYSQPNSDNNWNIVPYFIDDFTGTNRSWNNIWHDTPQNKLRAFLSCSGVTHGPAEHQVYQRSNAIFDQNNETLLLRATYEGGPLTCNDYTRPSGYSCDASHNTLYYFSGVVEPLPSSFLYGYFEIRCKLPVHRGAFPAFWLWGASNNNYREIDIFEYSWEITDKENDLGSPRIFTAGSYYSNNFQGVHQPSYGRVNYKIPENEPDLTNWNTFAAEWNPRRIIIYFNDNVISEYYGDSVPSLPMALKANYALDNWVLDQDEEPYTEFFPDDMMVDYIKVYKLRCDCENNAIIQNNSQLTSFDYKVKNNITIGGYGSSINIPANDKVVLRATNSITINADFEVPLGSELELITHPCPQ